MTDVTASTDPVAKSLRPGLDALTKAAADFGAQVTWRDMESRSLAQISDALGKVAQMLEVPPQAVWHLIPGFSRSDVEDMRAEATRRQARLAREQLAQAAAGIRAGSVNDVPSAD